MASETMDTVLARLMLPTDANPAGNVHGGTIMKMIEEAASVEASRHANKVDPSADGGTAAESGAWITFARMEHMDFWSPMRVGDLARVEARAVWASPHSVAVTVRVMRMSIAERGGKYTVTNEADCWCVALEPFTREHLRGGARPVARAMPPVVRPSEEDDPQGARRFDRVAGLYAARKAKEGAAKAAAGSAAEGTDAPHFPPSPMPAGAAGSGPGASTGGLAGAGAAEGDLGDAELAARTPAMSATELVQMMLPSDCVGDTGLVAGGVVMKLMDNAAGVVAARHCGTNVVTVSVDEIDLLAPVLMGDLVFVRARPVFTSGKSMQIEVSVHVERFDALKGGRNTRSTVVTTRQAVFTFVSLNKEGRPVAMPALAAETTEDAERMKRGQSRYDAARAARAAAAAAAKKA